jgi:WD40 repeat protein
MTNARWIRKLTTLRPFAQFLIPSLCVSLSTAMAGGQVEQLPYYVVQDSHHAEIRAAAFSKDGTLLLSGGVDGVAILWHVASGRIIRRFVVNGGNILAVAFASGGRILIGIQGKMGQNSSIRGAIEVWDAATGQQLSQFGPDSMGVRRLAFSLDGQYAITATDSGEILWEVASGRSITTFHGSKHPEIEELSFGPGGHSVLIGGGDNNVTLWDPTTGHALNSFGNLPNQIFALTMSPDGQEAVVGWNTKTFGYTMSGSPAAVSIWDVRTAREIVRFEPGDKLVSSVAISPNGKYLLAGFGDGTFRMWEISSRKQLWEIGGFPHTLNKALFSPDGNKIVTLAMSNLTMRDSDTGRELQALGGRSDETTSVIFTSSGLLITGNRDNTASVWDMRSGTVSQRLKGHSSTPYFKGVTSLAAARDGRTLITGGEDGKAVLWDLDLGVELHQLVGHRDSVLSVGISQDGKKTLTGSADKTAKLWDSTVGRETCTCSGNEGTINAVVFAADDSEILTGSSDGSLKSWSASDCRLLREVVPASKMGTYRLSLQLPESNYVRSYIRGPGEIESLAVSSKNSLVLTGQSDGTAVVWNFVDKSQSMRIPSTGGSASAVSLINDGKVLVTGNADSQVHLWDATTGQEIKTLSGHAEPVTSVAIKKDGPLLASSSSDGTTIVWDYSTGKKLAILMSVRGSDWTVQAGNDGRFDTSRFDDMPSSWIFPDDPFHPLAPETFMRDYYEPGLLPQLLAGKELSKIRPLASLNRVQPLVEVEKTEWQDAAQGVARVTVKVSGNKGTFPRNGKQVEVRTGVYDLRVFRDGQLVGWAPKSSVEWQLEPPPSSPDTEKNQALDLQRWREKTRVVLDADGTKHLAFSVQVPRRADLKQVTFTAYAFNEDRVKSATASKVLELTSGLKVRMGKAYIISVGVNRTDSSPNWDLQYAANDARKLSEVVSQKLGATHQFGAVVPLVLVSDQPGQEKAGEAGATKVHLQAVLDVLAGRRAMDEQLKREIPNIEKVEKAQPEDLVLLAFSSHGYTDERGVFHMVLADIGKNEPQDRITEELQKRTLSSDELSGWLREVDAGELVMIVDTCHSEATVAYDGFKPGPMGSRGLGQLAYDKGMRILAASKSGQSAIELGGNIKEGLLSYALVHEGLEEGKAAKDGKITMSGWLTYGAQEVPNLFSSGQAKGPKGEEPSVKNTRDIIYLGPDQAPPGYQQPVLFDFSKSTPDVVISQ